MSLWRDKEDFHEYSLVYLDENFIFQADITWFIEQRDPNKGGCPN